MVKERPSSSEESDNDEKTDQDYIRKDKSSRTRSIASGDITKDRERKRRRRNERERGSDSEPSKQSHKADKGRSSSRKKSRRSLDSRKSGPSGDLKEKDKTRSNSDDPSSSHETSDEELRSESAIILKKMAKEFGDIKKDVKLLLELVDQEKGIEISALPDKGLRRYLKQLFRVLGLKKSQSGSYFLRKGSPPTLKTLAFLFSDVETSKAVENQPNYDVNTERELPPEKQHPVEGTNSAEGGKPNPVPEEAAQTAANENTSLDAPITQPEPKKRVLGPSVPTPALLAAAAKLTEAQLLLDEEIEAGPIIGPPPPAAAMEASNASDSDRNQQVERVLQPNQNPFQIMNVERDVSSSDLKKKYWRLSLLVHPDKCSHPKAAMAFQAVNDALKIIQDPQKRKAAEAKINDEEAAKAFQEELCRLKEAAQWRRMRGESIPGDDQLLDGPPQSPKRGSWMTELPPERKAAQATASTFFRRNGVTERGDASEWTDSPLERVNKAKMQYLQAYQNEALEASVESLKKQEASVLEASMMDKYVEKRGKLSLLEEHEKKIQEAVRKKERKKRSKEGNGEKGAEDWEREHPWKPWNRETDLVVGARGKKMEGKDAMTQGLSSRFSGGAAGKREFL